MAKKTKNKHSKHIKKNSSKSSSSNSQKDITGIDLRNEKEMAMDFAVKAYKKFDKIIKAIVLFGSTARNESKSSSDVDIVIIIDDASVSWDQELIAWYREELGKLVSNNRYYKELHITTIKLTSWWNDLMKGDPTLMNVVRFGEPLIDIGGFFMPVKALLEEGRIKNTPEAIHNALQRSPAHFQRSIFNQLNGVEGLFWAMVDSAQAALMAADVTPPSPDRIGLNLKETFVDKKVLDSKYLIWYRDLFMLHKGITHGEVTRVKGSDLDEWQQKTEEFMRVMAKIVNDLIDLKTKRIK